MPVDIMISSDPKVHCEICLCVFAQKAESTVALRNLIITMSLFPHCINQSYCHSNCCDWLPTRVITLISANQMSRPASRHTFSHAPKGNAAAVIEIADILLSTGIPSSDHFGDYTKLLVLRKNG